MAQYTGIYGANNMDFSSPHNFYLSTVGNGYQEVPSLGNQCQAFFRFFTQKKYGRSFPVPGGQAKNNVMNVAFRQQLEALGFEFVGDVNALRDGDWVFLNNSYWGHVAMFRAYAGPGRMIILGQNQGGANGVANQINISTSTFVGALRPRFWHQAPAPQPAPAPQQHRKSNQEIANEVLRGNWGNGNDRKARLEAAGYNYAEIQAIVNGSVPAPAPQPQFSVGEAVVPTNVVSKNGDVWNYEASNGIILSEWRRKFYRIREIQGDSAVLTAEDSGIIWGTVKLSNLRKA